MNFQKEKDLYLPLKKEWFDLIKSGEKKEEYREMNQYYERRFFNSILPPRFDFVEIEVGKRLRTFAKVVFTCGYPKADDTERRLVFKNPKIRIGEGKPEWGAEKGKKYFVITWEE
mgnify:FL=1